MIISPVNTINWKYNKLFSSKEILCTSSCRPFLRNAPLRVPQPHKKTAERFNIMNQQRSAHVHYFSRQVNTKNINSLLIWNGKMMCVFVTYANIQSLSQIFYADSTAILTRHHIKISPTHSSPPLFSLQRKYDHQSAHVDPSRPQKSRRVAFLQARTSTVFPEQLWLQVPFYSLAGTRARWRPSELLSRRSLSNVASELLYFGAIGQQFNWDLCALSIAQAAAVHPLFQQEMSERGGRVRRGVGGFERCCCPSVSRRKTSCGWLRVTSY